MKFNRILCGVDFSKASVLAFDAAVELARLFKAELHVMHVIEAYPVVPEWLPAGEMDDTQAALEQKATEAMKNLAATAAKVFNGTPVTTEITGGRAYVEILHHARDRESDLIVLGAKGLTLPEEAFAGTTAERVVKGANCSVLIVRGRA
jgi:nucleotide-binding universal stress UspA family protein